MQRTVGFCVALAIVLGLAARAQATTTLVVGNHNLLPNTPGQVIDISISGTDTIIGTTFAAMINGGGPVYSQPVGPTITPISAADPFGMTTTGHIFFGNANPPNVSYTDPQLRAEDFLTVSGTVVANGILATIVVDTTGFFGGDFPLALAGGAVGDNPGDTSLLFADFDANSNLVGNIHIVPEPSSVVLGLIGVAGLGIVAIRKRRARQA